MSLFTDDMSIENPKEAKKVTRTSELNKVTEYRVKNKFYLSILSMNNWKFKNAIYIKM